MVYLLKRWDKDNITPMEGEGAPLAPLWRLRAVSSTSFSPKELGIVPSPHAESSPFGNMLHVDTQTPTQLKKTEILSFLGLTQQPIEEMRWYQSCSQPWPCFVQVKACRLHIILKAETIFKPGSCTKPHASVQNKHTYKHTYTKPTYCDSSHLSTQHMKHLNLYVQ